MRTTKTWMMALLIGTLLCLAGCSVIGFFPAQAAERAADKVLDDIFPAKDAPDETPTPPAPRKT